MELALRKRGRPSNKEVAARKAREEAMKEADLDDFQELTLLKPEVGPFEAALEPFVEPKQLATFKQLAHKQGFEFEKWLLRACKIGLGVF